MNRHDLIKPEQGHELVQYGFKLSDTPYRWHVVAAPTQNYPNRAIVNLLWSVEKRQTVPVLSYTDNFSGFGWLAKEGKVSITVPAFTTTDVGLMIREDISYAGFKDYGGSACWGWVTNGEPIIHYSEAEARASLLITMLEQKQLTYARAIKQLRCHETY